MKTPYKPAWKWSKRYTAEVNKHWRDMATLPEGYSDRRYIAWLCERRGIKPVSFTHWTIEPHDEPSKATLALWYQEARYHERQAVMELVIDAPVGEVTVEHDYKVGAREGREVSLAPGVRVVPMWNWSKEQLSHARKQWNALTSAPFDSKYLTRGFA